jgi:hypothetical protein
VWPLLWRFEFFLRLLDGFQSGFCRYPLRLWPANVQGTTLAWLTLTLETSKVLCWGLEYPTKRYNVDYNRVIYSAIGCYVNYTRALCDFNKVVILTIIEYFFLV